MPCDPAADSRTTGITVGMVRVGAVLLAMVAALSACAQHDDVVAQISALGDGGPPPSEPMPSTEPMKPQPPSVPDAGAPDPCAPSSNYVLFSSIVGNNCIVPVSAEAQSLVNGFFAQQPPPIQSGEARPASYCDLAGGFFVIFYQDANQQLTLCPAYCAMAAAFVRAEEQRLLACQGLAGP